MMSAGNIVMLSVESVVLVVEIFQLPVNSLASSHTVPLRLLHKRYDEWGE